MLHWQLADFFFQLTYFSTRGYWQYFMFLVLVNYNNPDVNIWNLVAEIALSVVL